MDPYGWIFRNAVYPTWETWVRDRPIPEVQRYLEATQWFTLPQLETIQVGLMRRLLRHAYSHTEHYRAMFDAFAEIVAPFSADEHRALFYENTRQWYGFPA